MLTNLTLVNNDFREKDGIYKLFDGLEIPNLDKVAETTPTTNGHAGTETSADGEGKDLCNVDVQKDSPVTNGHDNAHKADNATKNSGAEKDPSLVDGTGAVAPYTK